MFHAYLNVLTFDTDVMRLHRFERRQLHRGACRHVKARAMPRALDLLAIQLALIERAAIVRAHIVNGIELAIHVAYRHCVVAYLEYSHALRWDIGHRGNRLPIAHCAIASHSAS